jgi:hypothetical protein
MKMTKGWMSEGINVTEGMANVSKAVLDYYSSFM